MGSTQLIAGASLFRQIGNDAAENTLAAQVITGQSAKRDMGGHDAALIGFDGEFALQLSTDPIKHAGPVGRRHESLQRTADHPFGHRPNEFSKAPVAVQDVAAACQSQGAFLHFLDEKAVGLVRRFQGVNPRLVVGTRDDNGIHISIADRIEGLLRLAQPFPKRVVFPAQRRPRVNLGDGTDGSGRTMRGHLPIVLPFTGMRSRPARIRSSLARSPMIRRNGRGSIFTSVGAATIWNSFAAAGC
jgi:hypothetical protein